MKKMLSVLFASVLALGMTAVSASAAESAGDWEYVQNKGKLTIGITIYEPINYYDANGTLVGFDTEYAQAVCEKLGVEPEFVEINWDTKEIELNAKNIDCIWNGMTITEERKENMTFSEPYVKNMQVVVVRSANAAKYSDEASLAGKAAACESGSAGEDAARSLKDVTVIPVGKQTDALLEVKAGTSDFAVLDYTLAKAMIGEGTDYASLQIADGLELSVEEYGIGFRKGSDLAEKVNEATAILSGDGTMAALAEKYGVALAK